MKSNKLAYAKLIAVAVSMASQGVSAQSDGAFNLSLGLGYNNSNSRGYIPAPGQCVCNYGGYLGFPGAGGGWGNGGWGAPGWGAGGYYGGGYPYAGIGGYYPGYGAGLGFGGNLGFGNGWGSPGWGNGWGGLNGGFNGGLGAGGYYGGGYPYSYNAAPYVPGYYGSGSYYGSGAGAGGLAGGAGGVVNLGGGTYAVSGGSTLVIDTRRQMEWEKNDTASIVWGAAFGLGMQATNVFPFTGPRNRNTGLDPLFWNQGPRDWNLQPRPHAAP